MTSNKKYLVITNSFPIISFLWDKLENCFDLSFINLMNVYLILKILKIQQNSLWKNLIFGIFFKKIIKILKTNTNSGVFENVVQIGTLEQDGDFFKQVDFNLWCTCILYSHNY